MWKTVAAITKKHHVLVRVVLDNGTALDWSPWFTLPSDSYGEVKGFGPFSLENLRMLLINPVEVIREGQRIPAKQIDHTQALAAELAEHGVQFERTNGFIAVPAALSHTP